MSENHTGAALLGVAIRQIFPHVQYLGSGVDSLGFYAEFSDSEPFQQAYLPMLENAMKKLQNTSARLMEMLPQNAAEFLSHHKEKELAKQLQHASGTVYIAQIEEFFDIVEKQPREVGRFSLLKFEQKGSKVRVQGSAFKTEKELKTFLKKYRQYPQKNHAYLAKELDLYENANWHPRGMRLRQVLIEMWRKELAKAGFEQVETADPFGYFQETKREQFCYFDGQEDHIYSFQKDGWNSCLQCIEKWVKIFGFECEKISVSSRRIELRIADGIGRYWTGPYIEQEKGTIHFSLFGSLERFIALLLEKHEGKLPFALAPEQVRLLPFEGVDCEPVIEIFNQLEIRSSVEERPGTLKEKMHRALQAKVPYVMVFGKREEKTAQMTIRAYGSSQEMRMTLEEWKQLLAEQKIEI
ncbi:MAG: Threonine--tRNA ligase 2 [Chlamydiae bacterium]|nr:Threonine--tRNA ligase 2 [Chlamydiota bacterium]